ncbi:MAG: S-adenosylmethionine decarboxylase [Azospira oryzae]|jgi:S-adenosylmethionine decarboxylase|nr:MAG: S-adenosylmethionine decarboxylase [Azospira oryzae]
MITASTATTLVISTNAPTAPEGLHILSNFNSAQRLKLNDWRLFRNFIDGKIEELAVVKVGEAYHNFEGGGFTAVICLAESHLSIHTWPDRQYVTFDVFLSNYRKDNRPKTEAIYKEVLAFFDAIVRFENYIQR